VSASQPTIIATSIGFRADGPDALSVRPGPSYRLAAELAQAHSAPRVCIIPTAGGENTLYLSAYHHAFSKIGMVSSHLTLFPMPNIADIRSHLLAQDIIWVGGGSTANLLALWRLHGLDLILRECWEAGVVLKGVSAGSICWHVGGTTDSFGLPLQAVTNGLGFLPYSNSPHYDTEEERRPLTQRLIGDGTLPDGYATENGTGLVFLGTELQYAFTEEPGKTAYAITRTAEGVNEEVVETRLLPD
jgi:cyanophycinase-like exopeptidase